MKLLNWLKTLLEVVNNYKIEISNLKNKVCFLEERIKKETSIHIDAGYYEDTVIVIGRHKNKDFIQAYSLREKDFDYTVNMLKELTKHGEVKIVDTLPKFKSHLMRALD